MAGETVSQQTLDAVTSYRRIRDMEKAIRRGEVVMNSLRVRKVVEAERLSQLIQAIPEGEFELFLRLTGQYLDSPKKG